MCLCWNRHVPLMQSTQMWRSALSSILDPSMPSCVCHRQHQATCLGCPDGSCQIDMDRYGQTGLTVEKGSGPCTVLGCCYARVMGHHMISCQSLCHAPGSSKSLGNRCSLFLSFPFLPFSSKAFGHVQAAQKLEQEAFVPEEEADDEVRLVTIIFRFLHVLFGVQLCIALTSIHSHCCLYSATLSAVADLHGH